MNMPTLLSRAAATAAIAATFAFAAPQAAQAVIAVDTFTTYQFQGTCFGCNPDINAIEYGTATLVLRNFTGGTFGFANFVSFAYQSVKFTYDSTATGEGVTGASGAIPGTNGGPGDIVLDFLNTDTDVTTHFEATSTESGLPIFLEGSGPTLLAQNWCIGTSISEDCPIGNDFGIAYTLVSVNPVPEPATLALLGAGLLALGATRRRRG